MSHQGKRKTTEEVSWTSIYIAKNESFLEYLMCIINSLCSLARFDLANRSVGKPIQPHIFYARVLVFDETLAQPDLAVVNCSDVVMSLFFFHSSLLTRKRIFCTFGLLFRSVKCIVFRFPAWNADSLYSVQ